MEKSMHLAIASVPFQQWKEVYEEAEAFKRGTIFPELDKPFFITEDEMEKEKECACGCKEENVEAKKLRQIQKAGFLCDDLRLYLDTHPEDQQALSVFKETLKRKKMLMKEFALSHYPLTVDGIADIYEQNPESTCYCWKEGPIPWEKNTNSVERNV